eukprot:TRINITY_DN13490_c0_g1_i1.p1 TRINITY_DN13490_c0_g1~~TRINITY_DN13490_c0_g1_i1.p1  ORF type:complete len:351 (-),score=103.41 TRINITY_DN13490_c0_g1_i1:137-1189(-)
MMIRTISHCSSIQTTCRRLELQSRFLMITRNRIDIKTGEKSDYLAVYQDFAVQESQPLKNFIGKSSNVTVLAGYDFKLTSHPNDEASLKQLADNRESLMFYRITGEKDEFLVFKPALNMSVIELAGPLTFRDKNQTILAFKDGKAESRAFEIAIDGKVFKKYESKILAVLTLSQLTQTKHLHIFDPYERTTLYTREVLYSSKARNPMIDVHENVVLLTAPNEDEDEVVLVEMVIAPEMSGGDGGAEKVSLKSLAYPLVTTVKLDWKIKGIKIIQDKDAEKIVVISTEHEIAVLDLQKLDRGKPNKVRKEDTRQSKLPSNIKLKYPVLIEHNQQRNSLLIYNLDLYEFHLE